MQDHFCLTNKNKIILRTLLRVYVEWGIYTLQVCNFFDINLIMFWGNIPLHGPF